MGELTYSVPTVGELVTAACPKVDTALTQIKAEVNGKIEAINVKNESLEVKNLVKSGKWKNEGEFGAAINKSEKLEKEPSATENTLVMLTLILTNAGGKVVASILVGGAKIGIIEYASGSPTVAVGAIRVPAGEKWAVEVSAGSGGAIQAVSEFAYMKGVV